MAMSPRRVAAIAFILPLATLVEYRLVGAEGAVGADVLPRDGDVALVDAERASARRASRRRSRSGRSRRPSPAAARARARRAPRRGLRSSRSRRASGADSFSRSTVIRPERWCVIPAPAQSTMAFARSSFVGKSARCTVPQASWAFLPLTVLPPSICITAAPRPIAAIVPLSLYLNGFVSLPAIRSAIVLPACSPDWRATDPSCGSTWLVFWSVMAATSPTAYTSGCAGILSSSSTPIRFPRSSSSPSDWTSALPCRPAPQTSVCAGSTAPDLSVTRCGVIDSTTSLVCTSTPRFVSASSV